jgi:hypothetical protein
MATITPTFTLTPTTLANLVHFLGAHLGDGRGEIPADRPGDRPIDRCMRVEVSCLVSPTRAVYVSIFDVTSDSSAEDLAREVIEATVGHADRILSEKVEGQIDRVGSSIGASSIGATPVAASLGAASVGAKRYSIRGVGELKIRPLEDRKVLYTLDRVYFVTAVMASGERFQLGSSTSSTTERTLPLSGAEVTECEAPLGTWVDSDLDLEIQIAPDDLRALTRVASIDRWSLGNLRRGPVLRMPPEAWGPIVSSGDLAPGCTYGASAGGDLFSALFPWADEVVGVGVDAGGLRLSPVFTARMWSCWRRWKSLADAIDRGWPVPMDVSAADESAGRVWDRTVFSAEQSERLRERLAYAEAKRAARETSVLVADADLDLALANCPDADPDAESTGR